MNQENPTVKQATVTPTTQLVVAPPDQLPQTVSAEFPVAPTGVEVDVDAVRQRCEANVTAIISGDARTTVAQLSELGIEDQRAAARELELLKRPIGELLQKVQEEDPVETGLIELRRKVDEINPNTLMKGGPVIQFIAGIPVIGPPIAAVLRPAQKKVLYRVSVKYETVNEFIDNIVRGIREGMDMLLHDNVELETLYQNFAKQQYRIAAAQYEGLVQMWLIDQEMKKHAADSTEYRKLEEALNQIVVRVQDLAVMFEVNAQAFVGIDMTKSNNKTLCDAAERTLTVVTNLLTISLAIQSALGRQARVAAAVHASREAAGNMLAQNAAAVRTQTKQIGNLYTDPSVAMDKLQQAHDDLIASITEVETVKRAGIEQARKNIHVLEDMSAETMKHADAVRTTTQEINSDDDDSGFEIEFDDDPSDSED